MKRFSIILALGGIVLVATEALSALMLYRYYAFRGNSLTPSGSAAVTLASLVVTRLLHGPAAVRVSADHLPVFVTHPVLGYAMNPGDFTITEVNRDHFHRFHLGVDEEHGRVTSYGGATARRRIFLTGDSAIFGWGVNDQDTLGWLLQQRLPERQVVNLSLTGYSTVTTLLQLQQVMPTLNEGDLVILMYHPLSNKYNVAAPEMLSIFLQGFEIQLADRDFAERALIPYGAVDASGHLSIRRIRLSCGGSAAEGCDYSPVSDSDAAKVTTLAFDRIFELCSSRFVVALVSGSDDDPVVAHLRSRAVPIIDLRSGADDPNAGDVLATDAHIGPFRYYDWFLAMMQGLQSDHLID